MAYRFIQTYHKLLGLRWLLRRLNIFPYAYYNYLKNHKSDAIEVKIATCAAISNIYHDIIFWENKASSQVDLIRRVNLVIQGWSNYHKHTVASKTFSNVNNTLYLLLQRWAKHRHPNKTSWWKLNKYWHRSGDKPWLFSTTKNALINLRTIHIARHPKLQLTKNPFLNQRYFKKKKRKIWMINAA